jgi:hypothetical protein
MLIIITNVVRHLHPMRMRKMGLWCYDAGKTKGVKELK